MILKILRYYLGIVFLALACCTSKPQKETGLEAFLYNHVPMPMDTVHSLKHQWEQKTVLASTQLDDMESLENWESKFLKVWEWPLEEPTYSGESYAKISLSTEKVSEGKTSIKFVCPTKLPIKLPTGGRFWGREYLTRTYDNEDFSEHNRISVDVFPVFEGFQQLYLTLILYNDDNVPDKYGKSGHHTYQLKNNQWNKIIMEIGHLPRDKVKAIAIDYGMQGNEPGAADTIIFYADNLMLETVEPDYFEGWGTNDEIIFTHTGYNINSEKTAFTSLMEGGKFKLIDLSTNKTVLEKDAVNDKSHVGDFSVFDFSEVKTPGSYKIIYGNKESLPFPINEDVWLSTLQKTINLLYCLRCGDSIPGIHQECHTDWYTVYKGDTIVMNGGWHDAGDLSQMYSRTTETVGNLFRLARNYQSLDKRLTDRIIEEALWGLKWVQKNRFDGLELLSWNVHDHYSDGIIGNFDDTQYQPGTWLSTGIDIYYGIIANAEAAMTLKEINPELSEKSKQFAISDWDLLAKNNDNWSLERFSMAVTAGSKLFALTKNEELKNQTIGYADSLMTFQQTEPMDWSTPLSGFFYMNRAEEKILGYPAHYTIASPSMGLVEMCKLFPENEKYSLWLNSVKLHANYLKTIAQYTSPYYMIPANVYKLGIEGEDGQILQGVKMDETHYLRMFPVWAKHRGNNANILSFGIALAAANQILNDPEMRNIAEAQLEWIVGRNPFNQSLMYGEGYNFSPQYAAFPGDVTGALPVGIQTKLDNDVPFQPPAVFHNNKELWIHPSCRWLLLLDYLNL